jgi:RNA polymerase sigma factor (sigma-70 family)
MLSTLTEKNKTLIMLAYFEDKSYEEIAKIIGCKSSGVGTLLSRAKNELLVKIESDEYLSRAIQFDEE